MTSVDAVDGGFADDDSVGNGIELAPDEVSILDLEKKKSAPPESYLFLFCDFQGSCLPA